MYVIGVLAGEDVGKFNEIIELIEGFPCGVDECYGRSWIRNSIDSGSLCAITWILKQEVELSFRDGEGYTALHAALERCLPDRYYVLALLLEHGAPINAHGLNDWTAAHMAAFHEDIEALQILVMYGADLSIRTRIDDYATPLEEARTGNKAAAVRFLEGWQRNRERDG